MLAEFFARRREEVLKIEMLDFTFERRLELVARDSWVEGFKEGFEEQIKEIMGDDINDEVYRRMIERTIFKSVSNRSIDVDRGARVLDLSSKELIKKMELAGYKLPE